MDIGSLEQRRVLSLLAKNVFGEACSADYGVNWEDVYKESCSQSVMPLVFANSSDLSLVPEELRQKIESTVMRCAKSAMHNRRCHAYLHKLMTEAGIKYCVLKGVASAHYYPNPFLRVMGDVDFYVAPKDVEKACRVLEENGFTTKDEYKPGEGHHMVYRKPGIHFEMHYEMAGIPHTKIGEAVNSEFSDICEKATVTNDEFVTFMMPSAFHHGLVMLLHLQHHMLCEGIGLRHLCDWAVFVNSFKNCEFAELFQERLKKIGLWNFCRIITHSCVLYLSMPHPCWLCETDIKKTESFIGEVLAGGNFGRKRENRRYEGMIISVSGRDGKKKGLIAKGFATLNCNVRIHWPFLKKLPFLYPVAWVFFILRLFVLIIIGKRPRLRIKDSIKNSSRRNEFYDGLKLFEPEEDTNKE